MYGTSHQPLYSPNNRSRNHSPSNLTRSRNQSTSDAPVQHTYSDTLDNANNASLPQVRSQWQNQTLPKRSSQLDRQGQQYPLTQQEIQQHIEPFQQPPQRSFSTGDLKSSIQAGEQQTKVVNESIEKVESHFPQFVQDINLYTVRSAKLRDAGDNFAKSLHEYAQSETPVLKKGLSGFSECFAAVQDHRNVLVNRLENKVVESLSVYETRCKQAKIDVKQHNIAHMKELSQHKSYEKVKAKSTQQFQLAKAEAKFKKASEEASRSAQILSDQISDFERQKIRDLKSVFGELMLSEMLFYAKAIEIYTRAYQELMDVDEDEDIDQLQQSMKPTAHEFSIQNRDIYGGSAPNIMHPTPQPNMAVRANQLVDRTL